MSFEHFFFYVRYPNKRLIQIRVQYSCERIVKENHLLGEFHNFDVIFFFLMRFLWYFIAQKSGAQVRCRKC